MLREKISLSEIIIYELLLSFFLGFVPVMILVRTQTGFDVVGVLTTLNPGDNIVIYLFYLFVFQIIIWFVNTFWFKPNERTSNIVSKLHKFSHKLGFAIQGIYRALAGAVPAALIILLEGGLAQGWEAVTALSLLFAFGCFTASVSFEKIANHTAPK